MSVERVPLEGARSSRAIPVLRPLLPTADDVLPYLRRIDAARTYTNHGPLAREFETRVAALAGVPRDGFVGAASGTAALAAAILAKCGRAGARRPLALLPAYTFVATVIAVEQCGFEPFLCDVDAETWALDPATVRRSGVMERAGVVVAVAPYGRSFEQRPWVEFERATRIPVVVDGAACLDALSRTPHMRGPLPVALSFHATKSFGIGEGGAVVTTDRALAERTIAALNFGFFGVRESRTAAINGKLSEYHAAVGLAVLDAWPARSLAYRRVAETYRACFAAASLGGRVLAAPEVDANYALFVASDVREATAVRDALEVDGIGYRLWYGEGVHRHAHYASLARAGLETTAALAPRIIGLPTAPDFLTRDAERVAETVARGIRASKRGRELVERTLDFSRSGGPERALRANGVERSERRP